ncbi:hypothetical protein niasHT_001925 [Heterodera trifolii]|uniref:Plus3 domain-containing protein n=1 Tax=Heterodera trifolii TaxID=157864 RepID=A0ABD2LSQ3_9BILA
MEPNNNNNDQANQRQQTDISKSIESTVLPTMMELGGDEANASSPRAAETAQMPSLNATTNGGPPGSCCDGTVVGAPLSDNGHQNDAVAAPASLPKTTKALGEPANSGVAGGGGVDSLDQPSDDVEESHQAEELVVKEECIFPQDEYMEDEELQLVDQHNDDSAPENGIAAAITDATNEQQQKNNGTTTTARDGETKQNQPKTNSDGGANNAADHTGGKPAVDSKSNAEKEAEEMRKKEDPAKHIQTPEEMKRLILTQGQLKRLQLLDIEQYRQAVIGFYVRVNYPGLPSKFSTTIFIDQIGDVMEAESFQHLWLKRRLRLRRLGDYSMDKILPTQNVKNDQDIVSWFSYIEAKEEESPTLGFVHQKENDLAQAIKTLELEDSIKKEERSSPPVKKDNLMQIALSPSMLRLLAKLEFERFRDTVTGCFVFMPCISKEKPSECQYHIIEVKDVVHGPREYKIYKKGEVQAKIDYQLVFPLYGKYAINWIHTFHKVNEEGFKLWLSDMRQWKETLPTIEHVRDKAAQLQMALSDAEQVPDLEEQERARQREEERARRAKLPAQNAKDLDPCTLSRPQLMKLATLNDRAQFAQAITGCFIRLNAGAANHFEIDQIVKVEHPPSATDEAASKKAADKAVLELKVTGTISLTALTYIASNFKFTEDEFRKSWLAETTEANPLPTMEMVQQKQKELEEAFRAVSQAAATADAQQRANAAGDNRGGSTTSAAGGSNMAEAAANAKSNGEAAAGAMDESANEERKATAKGAAGDGETTAAQAEPGSKGPVATNADGNRTSAPSVQVRDGQLTMIEMRKVLISMSKLLDLMTMDKETLIRVLRGFYARVAAKRPDKPQALQFYIDQISGVSWGGEPYRFRSKVMTDIRLHFRHMGERTLYQLHRTEGVHLTNESFQMFIDDMKKWKHQMPLLSFIDKKVREFSQAQRRSRPMSSGTVFGSSPPSLAPSRRSLGELRNQPSPVVLPVFEQIHNVIQRQVASSVLTTPGMAGGRAGGGGNAPFLHSPPHYQWQQQPQQHHQQQQSSYMMVTSGGGGGSRGGGGGGNANSVLGPSLMSMASPFMPQHQQQQQQQHQPLGKESWRGSQRQLMDMEVQQPKYGGGGGGGGGGGYHQQRGMERDIGGGGGGGYDMRRSSGGGGGYDDFGASAGTSYGGGGGGGGGHGMMQQQQPPPLGSSLASAGHYNTSLYGGRGGAGPTPPKRHRYASPQPPPVERFF